MDKESNSCRQEALNIELGSIKNSELANFGLPEVLTVEPGSPTDSTEAQIFGFSSQDGAACSAHIVGHDSWKQVGMMLVTGFSCGWILSFSNLMLVPLGWAWGIPSLFIIAFFVAYSSWLLASFHFLHGKRFIRYKDIMGYLFGNQMYYVTWVLQFLNLLLCNIGFILLGGRAIQEISMAFSESSCRLQYFIIITGAAYFTFAIIVPCMSAMRMWLGASALLTLTYVVVLLVAIVPDGKSNKNRSYKVEAGSTADKVFNFFGAISAIILCNSAGMLLEIQSTLKKPAMKNMKKAMSLQFTVGLVVYYGVSIVGYWAYGSAGSEYLLTQLSGPKWAKVLINSAVFLQNIISQHMFAQPIHEALDTRFLRLEESMYSGENIKRRLMLRAFLFTGNTFVAAAIPFMGNFVNLAGSLSLVPLTFIFPSMIFIKVQKKPKYSCLLLQAKGMTATIGEKAWHWTLMTVFSLVAAATTTSAVRLICKNVKTYDLFADN